MRGALKWRTMIARLRTTGRAWRRARSALDEAQIRAIMAAQASREQRLAAADDVIDNSGTFEHLREQVDALHLRYSALAAQRA